MQRAVWAIVVCALTGLTSAVTFRSKHQYGPGHCVSIDRSEAGTCVIRTNCDGKDLSYFEFAFDCVVPSQERTRHSFGVGGFDSNEDFDTDIQCERCEVPGTPTGTGRATQVAGARGVALRATPPAHPAPVANATLAAAAAKVASVTSLHSRSGDSNITPAAPPAGQQARYGPDHCVSVWRGSSGSCVMATNCSASIDLTSYEFGFLCVNGSNALARHLFGRDSFNHNETFDTLVQCTHCLGLDELDDKYQAKGIQALKAELAEMRTSLGAVTQTLAGLNANVLRLEGAVAARGAAVASPAPSVPSGLVPATVAPPSALVAAPSQPAAVAPRRAALVVATQAAPKPPQVAAAQPAVAAPVVAAPTVAAPVVASAVAAAPAAAVPAALVAGKAAPNGPTPQSSASSAGRKQSVSEDDERDDDDDSEDGTD